MLHFVTRHALRVTIVLLLFHVTRHLSLVTISSMMVRMAGTRKDRGTLPCGYRYGGAVAPRAGATLYHLGLGANLGDRRAHLEAAVAFLGGIGRVRRRSSVYETDAVGMPGSPPFLNMAVALETALPPLGLLKACKAHEAAQGRDLENSHLRDRTIDIDILLAGNLVLATPELTIPHPRLAERGFVLLPLFEIAPRLVHPVEKDPVFRLLSRLKGAGEVRRIP
jgi:2-amino-4-hydroxy-6-hydroxymethyldihydropteridine diphosphokinase